VLFLLVDKRSALRTAPASGGALLHTREKPTVVFPAYTLFPANSEAALLGWDKY